MSKIPTPPGMTREEYTGQRKEEEAKKQQRRDEVMKQFGNRLASFRA